MQVIWQIAGQKDAPVHRDTRRDKPGQLKDDCSAVGGNRMIESGLGRQLVGLLQIGHEQRAALRWSQIQPVQSDILAADV
ncbi:hypothetical protein PHISCL_11268, partial [Aspergillus sclerotialis]